MIETFLITIPKGEIDGIELINTENKGTTKKNTTCKINHFLKYFLV